ncbi:MAG: hypothetical protein JXA37_10120, partial [Chloroflexia bacterium]|nr:hypothetical protein [Chloroflexia bacterium]
MGILSPTEGPLSSGTETEHLQNLSLHPRDEGQFVHSNGESEMKTRYVLLAVLVALVATLLLLRDLDNSAHATKAVATSLAYQADIYGGTGLETIEYLSDLQFHSWGNFGINAHVLRSRLRTSGDE